ncbi:MAG TPA: integrase, partial [Geobacteraceae bacterium]|nr:integrase [Geobacteraceae bacterium]
SEYIFAKPNGKPYRREGFIKGVWQKALKAANVPYQPPYSIRHTFAAWSLTIRMNPLRLVRLMGHGSKQMVFDTYGNYVEGLEQDTLQILEYFGKDFIQPKYPYRRIILGDENSFSSYPLLPANAFPGE